MNFDQFIKLCDDHGNPVLEHFAHSYKFPHAGDLSAPYHAVLLSVYLVFFMDMSYKWKQYKVSTPGFFSLSIMFLSGIPVAACVRSASLCLCGKQYGIFLEN